MTGHGLASAERASLRVDVELRAVNHRFLDLKVRAGAAGAAVEERVAAAIRERLARGAVTASVRARGGAAARGIEIDWDAAARVYAELERLAQATTGGAVPLELVCAQPGVISAAEPDAEDGDLAACAEEAAARAAEALVAAREREGEALAADLAARTGRMTELVDRVAGLAEAAPADAARALEERIGALLKASQVEVDSARVAQEAAATADRIDVTEELVRARAHLDQARELIRPPSRPVGRRLDFLAQEIGREINTIGSKSQSAEIGATVVDLKAELEKLREQVQNVE